MPPKLRYVYWDNNSDNFHSYGVEGIVCDYTPEKAVRKTKSKPKVIARQPRKQKLKATDLTPLVDPLTPIDF